MNFSESEIRLILLAFRDKYGPCYSDDPEVAKLQARLSMMLQMVMVRSQRGDFGEVNEGAG